jgi:uncharacterized protein (DUF1697 family)
VSGATTKVALLRGINVGKNKRVAMADLRTLLTDLGYGEVKTLLQSGNAVFTTSAKPADVERAIEKAISDELRLDVRVLVRTAPELGKVVATSPIPEGEAEGSRYFVAFLSAKPAAATWKDLAPEEFLPEKFAVIGREAYVWCAKGLLESAVMPHFSEKRLGVAVTVRNWNTVTKLLALCA